MPVILLLSALTAWRLYVVGKFKAGIKWILLEIKPPLDVEKSPKLAESIFAGIHGTYLKTSPKKNFFKGEIPVWFSFEIVGTGGNIKFYVRCWEVMRNLIEAEIFGQYHDCEIKVVDDYMMDMPQFFDPKGEYGMFGAELIFNQPNVYPIKTYPYFEERTSKGFSKIIDPLSPLAETMSTLQPGEHIWLQFLVKPTGNDWVKESQAVINKLIGKEAVPVETKGEKVVSGIFKLTEGALREGLNLLEPEPLVPVKEEKKKEEFTLMRLTPGQKIVLEMVENKASKLGFKVGIRFIYLARNEIYNRSRISGVIGTFKQLYANDLNSFKPNPKTATFSRGFLRYVFPGDRGFFASAIEADRKEKIYRRYLLREIPKQVVILNTEELATLWHIPGQEVKAPTLERVESKKGEPPAGLPR
ncbi:MAG: hypothetical protein CEN90_5 [Parcubacteria group bacterium Licking1014_17]|nr:MAG: hypothetical protein CEN90_5 [Parcubacteria group bacterium Licking1014_17]